MRVLANRLRDMLSLLVGGACLMALFAVADALFNAPRHDLSAQDRQSLHAEAELSRRQLADLSRRVERLEGAKVAGR